MNHKLADSQKEVQDGQGQRARLLAENGELNRRLEEFDGQVQLLNRAKAAMTKQLEEMKVSNIWPTFIIII